MTRTVRGAAPKATSAALRALLLIAAVSAAPPLGRAEPAAAIDFGRQVRPILSSRCFQCHGPDEDERMGGMDGLRLDTREGALEDLGGYAAIVPGKPEKSELLVRIADVDDSRMPPADAGPRLAREEVDRLTRWIREGAPYSRHWSYEKPSRPPLPEVKDPSWVRNAIDRFILARLEKEGLRPSPGADRYTLIRRVSLDLTGLPPTIEEVDAFVGDPSPDAYERLVDRLLDRPAYGEHWARVWLDLARYADSAGYADDPPRTIWAYRDYVIRALDENRPFDRFTIEQIAGDLLPDPTEDQRIATAMHRNTPTNNEGGTDDEEFRNVAVVDRVNTTMSVWMGTTMACAQCHNHKYDPISQEEYFRLFAIFNNTADADRRNETPVLALYTDAQKRERAARRAEIAAVEKRLRGIQGKDPEAQRARQWLAELHEELAEIEPRTTVPVMVELPQGKRRKTHVQIRGNYRSPGEEVAAGVPAAFHPLRGDGPPDRLALARWLVDEENPLTARVLANRSWERVFGSGLVLTSEDFGSQGDLPSHPDLLDWLATEVVRSGWDVKALLRLLVTSAAYRQSSRTSPELLEIDPDNRLLARGPRFRMPAEVIRDQALAASGLLSDKTYGPPVRPPQPSSGLKAAFGGGIDWKTSQGEDRYRRSIYTMWRRSNPYPSLVTFDAPSREVCTVRRPRTNTPLQALVTLNDPVYVEAAQALARRMAAGGETVKDRARLGFRLCLARPPEEAELARLLDLFQAARKGFANAPEQARRMATDPLGPAPDGADVVELATWTAVANVLLNLDETLMRP